MLFLTTACAARAIFLLGMSEDLFQSSTSGTNGVAVLDGLCNAAVLRGFVFLSRVTFIHYMLQTMSPIVNLRSFCGIEPSPTAKAGTTAGTTRISMACVFLLDVDSVATYVGHRCNCQAPRCVPWPHSVRQSAIGMAVDGCRVAVPS